MRACFKNFRILLCAYINSSLYILLSNFSLEIIINLADFYCLPGYKREQMGRRDDREADVLLLSNETRNPNVRDEAATIYSSQR